MIKTTLAVYLIFYKLIFFESLIIFIEPTIKLITGIFDFQNNNSYLISKTIILIMMAQVLFSIFFFKKDLHLNVLEKL